jgi:hypothetical protein
LITAAQRDGIELTSFHMRVRGIFVHFSLKS